MLPWAIPWGTRSSPARFDSAQGRDPVGVGGYDLSDIDGDGIIDVANIGTFGVRQNSGVKRTAAIFVKRGRGDGTFREMRVWRLPISALTNKGDVAAAFTLLPTRDAKRADVVFFGVGPNASVDVVKAR